MTHTDSCTGNREAFYRTLLESTRAIPWRIDWSSKRFSYIGPQIQQILGWPQDSWTTIECWAKHIHEDDREGIVNFCVSQTSAGIDHEADYRAIRSDGHHVWIRDVVHVIRDDRGAVTELVGFMFDISERKRTEEQVAQLQRELEVLSFRDSLTGIANRRHFDGSLEKEWRNAWRNREPIALVMLDIDHFKAFNDSYGHPAGDECLCAVARALTPLAARPRDVVARFGGEEFAILLPETEVHDAHRIARSACEAVEALGIPHVGSHAYAQVTLSAGCSGSIPDQEPAWRDLVCAADERLYRAKSSGRNRASA